MAKIVPFDPSRTRMSGGGDGPEDPMFEQRVARVESDISEIKSLLKELSADVKGLGGRFTKMEIDIAKIDGRFTGLDGRMSGLDARIAGLPSTWTMLGIVFTTWALGSGILIFAMNVLKR
ncbi:hypothetical protein [Methylocapsa aurea]|uniref:hypothetical protein n=1 Tax=Methylocapsa aurea TaxID=663610 RepID=UPI003D18E05F